MNWNFKHLLEFLQHFYQLAGNTFCGAADKLAVVDLIAAVDEGLFGSDVAVGTVAAGHDKGNTLGRVVLDEHAVGVKHFVRCGNEGDAAYIVRINLHLLLGIRIVVSGNDGTGVVGAYDAVGLASFGTQIVVVGLFPQLVDLHGLFVQMVLSVVDLSGKHVLLGLYGTDIGVGKLIQTGNDHIGYQTAVNVMLQRGILFLDVAEGIQVTGGAQIESEETIGFLFHLFTAGVHIGCKSCVSLPFFSPGIHLLGDISLQYLQFCTFYLLQKDF